MKVALADIDEKNLIEAGEKCAEIVGKKNVLTVVTDVSKLDQVVQLRDRVYEAWGEVKFFFSTLLITRRCIAVRELLFTAFLPWHVEDGRSSILSSFQITKFTPMTCLFPPFGAQFLCGPAEPS